jgi:hypothetical protein
MKPICSTILDTDIRLSLIEMGEYTNFINYIARRTLRTPIPSSFPTKSSEFHFLKKKSSEFHPGSISRSEQLLCLIHRKRHGLDLWESRV